MEAADDENAREAEALRRLEAQAILRVVSDERREMSRETQAEQSRPKYSSSPSTRVTRSPTQLFRRRRSSEGSDEDWMPRKRAPTLKNAP